MRARFSAKRHCRRRLQQLFANTRPRPLVPQAACSVFSVGRILVGATGRPAYSPETPILSTAHRVLVSSGRRPSAPQSPRRADDMRCSWPPDGSDGCVCCARARWPINTSTRPAHKQVALTSSPPIAVVLFTPDPHPLPCPALPCRKRTAVIPGSTARAIWDIPACNTVLH